MLSDLLPPYCNNDDTLSLLNELFVLALSTKTTINTSKLHFETIFEFLKECVAMYGDVIERAVTLSLSGGEVRQIDWEIRRILEKSFLDTVTAVQESLGSVWTLPREQRNGQDAFETKPSPKHRISEKSNESLASILTLCKCCLQKCPLFLLRLPAMSGVNRDNDMLLRRALDSAIDSVNDTDPEVISCSIAFLTALVRIQQFY